MKIFLQNLLLTTLVVLGVVACQKNLQGNLSSDGDSGLLHVTIGGGADTKMDFTDETDYILLEWELGDKFSLYDSDGNLVGDLECVDCDGITGDFLLPTEQSLTLGDKYTAIYPASTQSTLEEAKSEKLANLAEQNGDIIKNLENTCYMLAENFTYSNNTTISFEHKLAVMVFYFESTKQPTKLVFRDGTVSYSVDLTGIVGESNSYTSYIMVEATDSNDITNGAVDERELEFSIYVEDDATAQDVYIISSTIPYLSGNRYNAPLTSVTKQCYIEFGIGTTTDSDGNNDGFVDYVKTVDESGEIAAILTKFRRCMMKTDGGGNATICYLDDSKSTQYDDENKTTATLDGSEGDVMVYFPEFYYRYEKTNNDYFRYYVSEKSIGDGEVHVEASLVGAYKGYLSNNYLYSHSGVTPTNCSDFSDVIAVADNPLYNKFSDAATDRGTGYQLIDYEQHCTIAMMLYARHESVNIQAVLGNGGAFYDTPTTTGTTNELGIEDTSLATTGYVNGLGIEGVYGGLSEWMSGVTVKNGFQWNIDYKSDDASGATSSNITRQITTPNRDSGWITKMAFEGYVVTGDEKTAGYCVSADTQYFDMAIKDNGNISTSNVEYIYDGMYYNISRYWIANNDVYNILRSGSGSSDEAGVSFIHVCFPDNMYIDLYSGDDIDIDYVKEKATFGSRLAFKGNITEAKSVTAFKDM